MGIWLCANGSGPRRDNFDQHPVVPHKSPAATEFPQFLPAL